MEQCTQPKQAESTRLYFNSTRCKYKVWRRWTLLMLK